MLNNYDVYSDTEINVACTFIRYQRVLNNPSGIPTLRIFCDDAVMGTIEPGESFRLPKVVTRVRVVSFDPLLHGQLRMGMTDVVATATTIEGTVGIDDSTPIKVLITNPETDCLTDAELRASSVIVRSETEEDARAGRAFGTVVFAGAGTGGVFSLINPIDSEVIGKVKLARAQMINVTDYCFVDVYKFSLINEPAIIAGHSTGRGPVVDSILGTRSFTYDQASYVDFDAVLVAFGYASAVVHNIGSAYVNPLEPYLFEPAGFDMIELSAGQGLMIRIQDNNGAMEKQGYFAWTEEPNPAL